MSSQWHDKLKKRASALDIETRAGLKDVTFVPVAIPGKVPKHFSRHERQKMSRYESVTTYEPQTTIYKDHLEYRAREPRWFIWVFVLVVGVLAAATAVLMVSGLHTLFAVRMRLLQFGLMGFSFDPVNGVYDNDAVTTGGANVFSGQDVHLFGLPQRNLGGGYVMWVLYSILMSAGASLLCAAVPDAIGPGSPEVLAYLNGVENPAFADSTVFAAKFVATLFTVSSGLPLGSYGTLAQCGTMLAASLLSRSRWIRCDAIRIISCFRNPRDRRIVTVIGAASGFASAFSVSIGGLMIVMEQLSTIFPVRFALYVFVACLISSVSLQTYFSYVSYFSTRDRTADATGQLISEVLIQFDTQIGGVSPVPMNVLVFFPAIILGVLCGALSVAFVRVSNIAFNVRRKLELRFGGKLVRYMLPIAMAALYSTLTFWFSAAMGSSVTGSGYECQALPLNGTVMLTRNTSVVSYYGMSGSMCEPNVYNMSATPPTLLSLDALAVLAATPNRSTQLSAPPVMHTYASLAFGYADSTLQMLLSWRTATTFPSGVVAIFLVVYFLLSAVASGVALTGDVMLPLLVIGACVGRLVGVGVYELWYSAFDMTTETWTDPGVFALIGAGCMFGGSTGMTFSICVILIEVSNDFRHVLPLMLGISIAKRICERFSHNANTAYLETRCVPLLDFDARVHKYDMFSAKHVMSGAPITLRTVTTIDDVLHTLRTCSHNAFPVESIRDGTFKGLILRRHLLLYLWHLYLTDSHSEVSHEQMQRVEDQLFDEELDKDDPLPPFEDFALPDRIDLSAHIDHSAFCALDTTSISRTYHLFRTLGLRHLVVVNRNHFIVGMITRKDLVTDNIIRRITAENDHRRQLLSEAQARALFHAEGAEDDEGLSSHSLNDGPTPYLRTGSSHARGNSGLEATIHSPSTAHRFHEAATNNAEWIVVDEGDDVDGPAWGGEGLGPMHPVMHTGSMPPTNSKRMDEMHHAPVVTTTEGDGDVGDTAHLTRLSAILRQLPSTTSVDDATETPPSGSAAPTRRSVGGSSATGLVAAKFFGPVLSQRATSSSHRARGGGGRDALSSTHEHQHSAAGRHRADSAPPGAPLVVGAPDGEGHRVVAADLMPLQHAHSDDGPIRQQAARFQKYVRSSADDVFVDRIGHRERDDGDDAASSSGSSSSSEDSVSAMRRMGQGPVTSPPRVGRRVQVVSPIADDPEEDHAAASISVWHAAASDGAAHRPPSLSSGPLPLARPAPNPSSSHTSAAASHNGHNTSGSGIGIGGVGSTPSEVSMDTIDRPTSGTATLEATPRSSNDRRQLRDDLYDA